MTLMDGRDRPDEPKLDKNPTEKKPCGKSDRDIQIAGILLAMLIIIILRYNVVTAGHLMTL